MEKVYLATAIPIPLVGREDCSLRSSGTLSLDVAVDPGSVFHDCQKKRKERNTLLLLVWALLVQAVCESRIRTEIRTLQHEKL